MLGHSAFYHNIIRKYIVAFGSLFNDIHVLRTNTSGTTIKDIKVPITFASKDKTRYQLNSIHSDVNKQQQIATILPRLSYTLNNNIEFDAQRVLNPLLKRQGNLSSDLISSEVMIGRPFNFNFQLSIWTKYLDDMFQIIEQILCFFNPDYHVTIKEIPEMNVETSIPIVYQSCSPQFETEFNDSSWRLLRFDMDFALRGWIYPPIRDESLIENIRLNFHKELDQTENVVIIKNEYEMGLDSEGDPDPDIDGLLYSAIVENTESFFSAVDSGDSIKPYAQLTMNVYKSEQEPILGNDEQIAYWIDETNKRKYIIRKTSEGQTLIPY